MENNLEKNTFKVNNNKSKYKYELKIINDSLNEKNKLKSKSQNSIISSINFTIINKSPKQNIKYKVGKIKRLYEHYDDFNNYKFYESKSSRIPKSERPFLKKEPQQSSQINIFSIKNEKNKIKLKNNNFNNIDNKRIESKREANNDIFTFRDRNRKNNSVINNNIRGNDYDEKNGINVKKILFKSNNINIERKYKNFNQYSINHIKKYFKQHLQIEKSIERNFCPQNKGISHSSLRKSINNNCLYYETSYLTKNKINSFIKNIINSKELDINKFLYIKKKLNKKYLKKVKIKNNSQIAQKKLSKSIYNSKQNNIIQYIENKMYTPQKKSHQCEINDFLNNDNISPMLKTDLNNNLKESERLERIKHFYLGKKIEPLMIIKTAPNSKNIKENKVTINDIKYSLLSTSLDTKPIMDLFKNNTLEKKPSNLYILMPEIKEDKAISKQIRSNKSSDDINKGKKCHAKKDRNKFIFKRKIFNNGKNGNSSNNNKNTNNISVIKNNSNIKPIEINDDLYMKKVIDNIYNSNNYYNLLNNINERNENNNSININEKIEYIKYLYYSYIDLDSFNQEKLENYFLKLSDEEKIAVLTKLNNGDIKNKKIYKALINILKEKRLKRANSIKDNNRNTNKNNNNNDNNANEEIKKKRNNSSIILFKKKTYLK